MTLTPTIVILTEEEVSRCVPPADEPGFGALSTARGPLPLKAMDVRARIDGLLAEVALTQTFVNTHAEPLEATYIFPLPDRAAVTEFRMEVAGRVVEGVLKERGSARREYDQAVQAGHRAAIAEEERPGVFTLRVGNLMPGEAATIRLCLSGPLVYDSGEVTFRFPLVVAPRYIPGVALPGPSVGAGVASDTDAVPDASRISPPVLLPGYPNPVRLSLSVEIESAALAPRDFRCSLHAALIEEEGRVARISLQPGERLNRDFILRFRVGDESMRSSLALLPDSPGARAGTFVLTLLPPAVEPRRARPRDVVFVLDRSGSMGGWKMVAARRALARMVDTLTERDRFGVYAFDDRIDTVPEFGGSGLAAASDRNRFRAVEFLARIDARGGTEMAQPLDLAVNELASGGCQPPDAPSRERILVLITDGQVGNEDQILRLLGKRLAGLRIFTLGIDQAVNEGFLKRLATLGGGFCEVVESEDRLDEVMKRLHSRIGTPLLTGLKLEEAGFRIEAEATVPARLPDLFAGAALQVMGRYQGVPEGSFLLSGHDAAGRRCCEAVSSRVSSNPALAKAWARARVRELEDRFATGQGEAGKLEKQILEVSLKFGVLCRFTSFVAVDRSEVVNEGGEQHRIVQPVEMPAGWAQASIAPAAPVACAACAPAAPAFAAPPAPQSAAPSGPGLLGRLLGLPANLGKSLVEFKKGVKGLPEDEQAGQASIPPPAGAAAPPESVDSCLMEFELTLDDSGGLSPLDADAAPQMKTPAKSDAKDIFETDFEAPALEEESGSEALSLDDADTGLDKSAFDVAISEEEVAAEEERARRTSKPSPPPPPAMRRSAGLRGSESKKRSEAPPSQQKREGKAPGLLGKVAGLFKKNKGQQKEAPSTPEKLDLSAYRLRAKDLLEPILGGAALSGPQRLHELGVLAVGVKALLDDLTSVGAPPLELQPLQKLLAELTALLEQTSPDDVAVTRLWAQAEEVLRVFAGEPAEAPVGSRREGFWK